MATKLEHEPDWFNGEIDPKHPFVGVPDKHYKPGDPIQEDDNLKPFLFDISNYGLNYAFQKYEVHPPDPNDFKETKTSKPKNILIIGAGMSGLVAGYELAQVGHNVQILELQHRVGGRIKTFSDDKFFPGLWSDAGAMRLPGTGTPDWKGPAHFMTDFYAQKFDLPLKTFINSTPEGYYSFYGDTPIKNKEWDAKSDVYCGKYWPSWRKTIDVAEKEHPGIFKEVKLDNIVDYWDLTVQPIRDQLYGLLNLYPRKGWEMWVKKWGTFSISELLRSTYEEVKLKLQNIGCFEDDDDEKLGSLKWLLPWPIDAVVGYKVIVYTLDLDVSLVDWLRDDLGQWWKDPMHTFEEGMQMLPNAFTKKNEKGWNTNVDLTKNIMFGMQAREIHYGTTEVTVVCSNQATKKRHEFKGDCVIITLPMNIVRQLVFEPALPYTLCKAIENISYSPSTKIHLQCKTQFWQKEGIDGGFTKTNMPIGQLHYPSNETLKPEDRGILMLYTWKQEALLFGSQRPEDAIAEAVEEVSRIHPEIYDNFEVGAVQPWYNDPSAQGAFCFPKPEQYLAQQILYCPHQSLYFCGEAISTTNGWIQGALVSGLRAAYQFYAHNEKY